MNPKEQEVIDQLLTGINGFVRTFLELAERNEYLGAYGDISIRRSEWSWEVTETFPLGELSVDVWVKGDWIFTCFRGEECVAEFGYREGEAFYESGEIGKSEEYLRRTMAMLQALAERCGYYTP